MDFHILHPYFAIVFIILLFMAYSELKNGIYLNDHKIWWAALLFFILAGFRGRMIDDVAYNEMYVKFGLFLPFDIEALQNNGYGIEWLYVLYGKIIYGLGMPYFMFVIITAALAIMMKFSFYDKNSAYPSLSVLMYMIPSFFITEMGHLRQGLAIGIVFLSFGAIKNRRLLLYLFLMYIAYGFHKSSIIFLPAYWLATIPLNKWVMLSIVLICIFLSPFSLYEYITLFNNIAPDEVIAGYSSYSQETNETTGTIKFFDVVSLFFLYFMFYYNEEAEEKIPYYEYMRNFTIIGICIYFLFRNSPVFSTRLVAYYFLFNTITIPNIIAAVGRKSLRTFLFNTIASYMIFYYFVFGSIQGWRGFSSKTYTNWLIGS